MAWAWLQYLFEELLLAISACRNRSRFFPVNAITSHTGSSIFKADEPPTTAGCLFQLFRNIRSLRTVYSTCNSGARSNFSTEESTADRDVGVHAGEHL